MRSECVLDDILSISSNKISLDSISLVDYISTDNMQADFGGVTEADKLPSVSKISEYRVDDILFSNIRTYFRKLWIADKDGGCSNDIIVFRAKGEIDPKFVFYTLMNEDFIQYTVQTSKGTKMPRGDKEAMKQYPVSIPSPTEQKAIARILGSLDDKIELNKQMNETLEAMAQALFKSWFVDFDPVIDNALAAGNDIPEMFAERAEQRKQLKSQQGTDKAKNNRSEANEVNQLFPDAFEYTEEMGWIPFGWAVKKLPEVIDFLEGPGIRNWQYTDDADGIKFINIRCIKEGDLKLETANKLTREEALGKYAHFQLAVDDIVVSTSGTLGRYAFVRKEHLPLSLNTSVIRFKKIEGISTLNFIAGYIDTSLQHELEIRASGSVQLNFGPMHLKQIDMLIPDFNLLQKHDEKSDLLFRKRQSNLKNIDFLTKLRDTLLPKLLSGELRIPDAEKLIAEAEA